MKAFFIIVATVVMFAFSSDRSLKYAGIASDLKSGKFYYTEEHEELQSGSATEETDINFKNAEGKLIVRKTIDYMASRTMPDFTQEDLRDGSLESARTVNGVTTLQYRKSTGKDIRSATLAIPQPAVIDGGFNCFVKEHWNELIAGKTISFNFAVPVRLDYYSFRIYKLKEKIIGDKNAVIFKMEANQFILRQLLSPIILTYNSANKRLMQYEGISNINDDDGNNYEVKIVYPSIGP